jgi:hypothetical protein
MPVSSPFRILLAVIGWALAFLSMHGQTFDSNCESLGEMLREKVSLSGADASQWMKKEFTPRLCASDLRPSQRDTIALFCNLLVDERITVTKGFLDYIKGVDALVARGDVALWADWHAVVFTMLQNRKWKKTLPSFLKQSPGLIANQVLWKSAVAQWSLEDAAFELTLDGTPTLSFTNGRLVGEGKGDRIEIHGVDGQWDLTDETLSLSGGRLAWEGTTFNPLTHYATLSEFSLKLDGTGFSCESALWYSELIEEPLVGKVVAKLKSSDKPEHKSFPRFESEQEFIRLNDIFPSVHFEGGVRINGSKITGKRSGESAAHIEVMRGDTLFLDLFANEFVFGPTGFSSDHVELNLLFREDTLFHPDVSVRFDKEKSNFQFMRQSEGLGQQAFSDTYHALDWDVEGFSWKMGETRVRVGSLFGGTPRASNFLSSNFFKRETFDEMVGIDAVHPLSRLNGLIRESGRLGFTTRDYAEFIHMSELQARVELMKLANAGFVLLDVETLWCEALPKAVNYIRNKSGRRDYDVLQWYSDPKEGNNAEWSLLNGFLSIHGVEYLQVSDSQDVRIFPRAGEVIVRQNRDFEFDGLIRAGNLDFEGDAFSFDFDEFSIRMNQITGVRMSVNDPGLTDQRGRHAKKRLKSTLEQVSGMLRVDHPTNRSGMRSQNFPDYPVFLSEGNSFVYFDQPSLHDGAYNRDDFYYAVSPFEMRGLNELTQANLSFEGTLVSAGILSDLSEPLRVMDDLHLGFKTTTPPNGQGIYDQRAQFTSGLTLDGRGLQGGGRVDFLTASVTGERFVFLPDSIIGETMLIENASDLTADVPGIVGSRGSMVFRPLIGELEVYSGKDSLTFFGESVNLVGSATLSDAGMNGKGTMWFEDAKLTSEAFTFANREIQSSSAAFDLKGRSSGIAAFQTDDVKCEVNFDERVGEFSPNSGETRIELPIQQYICFMDQFRWFMDKEEVDLISNRLTDDLPFDFSEDRTISNFVSIHKDQDSLHFLSTRATYRIHEDLLRCQKVTEMAVADVRIAPDSGLVIIRRRARMDELKHASLVANDVTRYHFIDDASIQVNGRYSFEGSGKYRYRDLEGDTSYIFMADLAVDDEIQTVGTGKLTARDQFQLSPAFGFAGTVSMASKLPHLYFEGGAKLLQPCDAFSTSWIQFEEYLDPLAIAIPISEDQVDVDGDGLAYGLMASSRAPFDIYPGFLDPIGNDDDIKMLPIEGAIRFRDGHYFISSLEKLEALDVPGNLVDLNAVTCRMTGTGAVNLPVDFNLVEHEFAGEFFTDASGNYHFNGSLLLSFHFHQGLFERMALQIPSWLPAKPLELSETNYEYALREWLGKEDSDKLIGELAMTGRLKNIPKKLRAAVILTGVELIWDPLEEAFISTSKVGIASLGKEVVFQEIPGKIELIRSRSGDSFKLYFHGDEENWYYMDYKLGTLNVTTTDIPFYNILTDVKAKKRKIKSEDGSRYMYQAMPSRKRRNDLVDEYRDFD